MKERVSKPLLKWLAVITGITLLGITALQVYWLTTNYTEQNVRFKADIENALTATSINVEVEQAMAGVDARLRHVVNNEALTKMIADAVSKMPKDYVQQKQNSNDTLTLSISDPALLNVADIKELKQALQAVVDSQSKIQLSINDKAKQSLSPAQLVSCSKILKKELAKRGINTRFELAILTDANHYVAATCDIEAFKAIPLKTTLDKTTVQFLSGTTKLQAAFPQANLYLWKRMAWIVSVSALLILICSASFAYLVMLFFRQKKMADIRNDFMNNMTHELKTPISSVSVALELLNDQRQPVSDSSRQEYFSIAQSELKRLNMLVDKILKMAAFDKSEVTLKKHYINAVAWMEDIQTAMKPILGMKDAVLQYNTTPAAMELWADETHLTNVMQNLIENAVKYNDKPDPLIEIEIKQHTDSYSITVTDNGKGIPPAFQQKVFDKFFRVPTGDQHDVKGYGLGLSYVQSIVQLHGGNITLRSQEDIGSTFLIIIPRANKD